MIQTGLPTDPNAPYALEYVHECSRRRQMLDEPHMEPLQDWLGWVCSVKGSRARIPNFDPLDGGSHARLLLLYRNPSGACFDTGFISINNPDPMARFVHGFLAETRIPRSGILCWNVVHWEPADPEKPTADDLEASYDYTKELLCEVRELAAIMLFGSFARQAADSLRMLGKRVVLSPMPSQRMMYKPGRQGEARAAFAEAAELLRR